MKPFLATLINEGIKPENKTNSDVKPAGECDTCNGTNVVSVAGETSDKSIQSNALQGAPNEVKQTADANGTTTVVMKGPLGEVFTQALDKTYARRPIPDNIDVGIETIFTESETQVQANGQVIETRPKSNAMARASLLVGMLPAPTKQVTCLNAALQAMGAVKAVDFAFVDVSNLGKNPSVAPLTNSSTLVVPLEQNLLSGQIPDNVAIESVEIVVRYAKR